MFKILFYCFIIDLFKKLTGEKREIITVMNRIYDQIKECHFSLLQISVNKFALLGGPFYWNNYLDCNLQKVTKKILILMTHTQSLQTCFKKIYVNRFYLYKSMQKRQNQSTTEPLTFPKVYKEEKNLRKYIFIQIKTVKIYQFRIIMLIYLFF